MRKIVVLAAVALPVLALTVYLVVLGSERPIVVDNQAQADDASVAKRVPLARVDHSIWDRLLKKYVDDEGMVDYGAWKKSTQDLAALKQYLATLGRGAPGARTTKEGKLAFWINAYNVLTVYGILEVYPTASIRNHTAVAFGYNIWKDLLLPVGDKKYSLKAIEHEILRKLGEPRIHFVIVCASIGCPRLLNEAYTPAKLEAQLADNTRDFFARRKHFQVDLTNRRVRVSSILDWFGEDFGPTAQKALASLAEYMPNAATKRLITRQEFSVSFLKYDWSLNEQ